MLSWKTPFMGVLLLLWLSPVCLAQNDLDAGLEKFFQSRKLIETLSIRDDGGILCSDCLAKIDNIATQLKKTDSADRIIRIEGFGSQTPDVAEAMEAAGLVHDYLRERYDIKSNLFLTGYPAGQGSRGDSSRVEIVTYDRILPVEDAKIETIIIR